MFEFDGLPIAPGSTNVGFSACTVRCRFCSGTADIVLGIYDYDDGGWKLKDASEDDTRLYKALRAALSQAHDHVNIDAVLEPIAAVSPTTASFIRDRVGPNGSLRGLLLILICVLATNLKMSVNVSADLNTALAQVHSYLTGSDAALPLPSASGSTTERQQRAGPTRQQKRLQERQSKSPAKPDAPPRPSKPPRPKSGKKRSS